MTADMVAWPAEDAAAYRAAGYWRGETYPQFLDRLTKTFGDRTAVVDDRLRLTYAELAERAERVARGMRDLGIGAGDRVLVQLPNRVEFLVLWFGLMKLGAVPVHAQPGHRHSEMIHLARLSGATAYVIPDVHARFDYRQLAQTVRAAGEALEHVIVVGDPGESGFTAFDDLASASSGTPVSSPADAGDLALLLLSGGTTGLPKLIPRTHDDYLYNARAAAEVCALDENAVYMATLPVAFNYTMNCPGVLGALSVGGTVVMAATPDPGYCFELIEREGVTITAINPQLAPVWLDEAGVTEADLSGLRVLQIGSARLSDDVARKMIAGFGCTIQQVFGMAEGLLCLTRLDDPAEIISTTQGRPISEADELRVVDGHDVDVPEGEVGELLTNGPYTLRGYYRGPEHAGNFLDGFYRTGDLVRRLGSGHVIVVGRSKDQINRGGMKIAAPEVEGHLQAHPGIRSAALLPAPDPVLGERSVAFIVPNGTDVPSRKDLVAYLADRGLAAYKAPDEVRTLSEMPLTPVGKMDKKVLAGLLDGSAE
ncbi:(2,3-dihydroxybenzoyl)adenylate synthase [Streptomyces sp. NL15-2K]|uniref:(2,3-dihydroxybenzoyl)adenylate synthase n=1 Tax=Streptomyces sp. NL15-2K TaxID=376149 RepID=UPI000F57FBB5|nr:MULTISPECIES: AMP-binding protein [Actinomycetes]WKX14099.1 AMP-binding protein [Kutzneria buriramensis]GCB44751.1 2,3-dihydroxybenzoate-AMP ligase [Streptomyces sp. NL15-2K]